MDTWTMIASSAFGLSFLVSALQLGNWALRANPRTLVLAGQWSVLALSVLAVVALIWLMANGRWTQAMMLAAFIMPVLVQGAPRWRAVLGPLSGWRGFGWRGFRAGAKLDDSRPSGPGGAIDPETVRQSIVVLTAYLEQTRRALEYRPSQARLGNGSGPPRMTIAEALAVLGLEAGAGADQIREAHCRLQHRLDPELGGTRYLTMQIDEALDILLENMTTPRLRAGPTAEISNIDKGDVNHV